MPSAASEPNAHWSQWWSEGHITSFGEHLRDNYDGAMREHWLSQLQQLPGGDVLDIATGNGALATLAVECFEASGRPFTVTATDLARIGTDTNAEDRRIHAWRAQVNFMGGLPCERQPFADASFDAVLSQYGFEYSDIDATLAEVFRLLRPGGRFLAVAHHASSAVIARQRVSARVYDAALDQLKLFRLLDRHLASWGKARGPAAVEKQANKPRFQKSAAELEFALRQFGQAFPGDETAAKVFCSIDDLRRDAVTLGPARREAAVKAARDYYAGTRARLADLFRAALDRAAMDRLESRARALGFQAVSAAPLPETSGQLVGWALALTR